MKRRIYLYIFYVIALFIEFLIIEGYANAVVVYPIKNPILMTMLLFFFFFLGTSIEYGVFRLIQNEKEKRSYFFTPVFKVNVVTFPFTQILAYIIYIYVLLYFWIYIIGIEILVVLIEWALLRIIIKRRFGVSISSQKILIFLIIGNLFSFLLGLIPFTVSSYTQY